MGRAGATASAASTSCAMLQVRSINAQRLRWRRAEGFMNTAEIVVRDVQRDRRNVIIKLL